MAKAYTQRQAQVFMARKSLAISNYASASSHSRTLVKRHQPLIKYFSNSNLCQKRSIVPRSDKCVEKWVYCCNSSQVRASLP